jgi:hypothetical protein
MLMDQFLVLGLLICVLAIPPLFSAFVDSRPPRTAAIAMLTGGTLAAVALVQKPGGYSLSEIPDVIVQVIANLIR